MLTSHAIWRNPLQWNKFPITHNWKDVVLEFTVTAITRSLSLNALPKGRMERLELIASLHDCGWNSVEIANHLNEQGMLTPSGIAYYPKLVWATRNKFMRRAIRSQLFKIKISGFEFFC
jgi:hypothetical protein